MTVYLFIHLMNNCMGSLIHLLAVFGLNTRITNMVRQLVYFVL